MSALGSLMENECWCKSMDPIEQLRSVIAHENHRLRYWYEIVHKVQKTILFDNCYFTKTKISAYQKRREQYNLRRDTNSVHRTKTILNIAKDSWVSQKRCHWWISIHAQSWKTHHQSW